ISEPILWYTDYAWQFPAMAVNDRGHIAGTAYVGGGPLYPSMNALIADDFSSAPAPWENYILEPSSKGSTNWGDWYSARRHGTNGNTWIATGQQRLADGTVKPWYVWFGRERDIPWPTVTTPTSSSVATTTAILGGNVTSNGGATITERGVVYSRSDTNTNPFIGGTGVTKVSTTGTTGVFTVNVSGLTKSTAYTFRAYATNSAGTGYTSTSSFTTQGLAAPQSFVASATSTIQVSLTWAASAGADHYEIARSFGGAGYTTIGTSNSTVYTDNAVSPTTTYLYKVRAVDSLGAFSPYSSIDAATTLIFTDDPLITASTLIRAIHVTQLRTAVNAVRAAAGLTAAVFTDPTVTTGMYIRAVHINELRNALAAARST